ncbi:ATP-dependent RNA helicase HrpA [Pseudohaliea rubra]|uniref:ATP-dependent helicase HrpA n=1 Tax=Pseudohaliea rubra DSM 19751 TaxID=1265313 RepID=A0A095X2M5_9GAMM|nr:ATP-dependent RNA helicase HrpA [Pseudohaliea rubra]KGE05099.1 ATP-dependent helicase HrpA [Pseudohaliea rubra DSM 19751]
MTEQEATAAPRAIPPIHYPEDLPVAALRGEIAEALASHQVVIVAGETGSGKTTQLPKICLELGRGRMQRIGHTQPRRLAARNVARRIAEELGTPLGGLVGFQVRFQDSVGPQTAVKLMTDGILLAELRRDRDLAAYDTLIIDEAHERSLNIDFLLGYLHQLLPRRPDLKVVITSATIDVERFSRHFDGAPVVEVPGRSYPVETHYLPPEPGKDRDPLEALAGRVREVRDGLWGPRGDMLLFLPGERDIRELAHALRGEAGLDVLPLYARLGQAEQARVFDPRSRRGVRVVLATNVAETSVTVPGIRYVIDPGEARINRYSPRSRIQRLPIEPVSRASADQRRGRCGRVGPGVCLRLYSEEDYLSRPAFTDPEIRRSNLAAVILQMLALRLGAVERFPFLEPPESKDVREGYRLLGELGAVDPRQQLTSLGKKLARLPIDPIAGRMILAASDYGCVAEVLVIASALAVQDPRERPPERQAQADQAHARFRDPRSDFLAFVQLWRYFEEQRQALSQNQLRKLCQREYLSFLRMREWRDIHRQLSIACRQQGIAVPPVLPEEPDYTAIHRALLPGLLSNIAQRREGREYLAARNRKLWVFPGSTLHRKPPTWLVAAEVVETSRVFARTAAAIEPDWLLAANPALLKRHYYEPRWQRGSGRVVATERVTLFGLTVSDGTTVHYGPIDPPVARELLIREGLVSGRWRQKPAFLRHNLAEAAALADLENRTRRRDLLVDEETLFAFYDERVPATITTAAGLARWLKRTPGADASLRLSRGELAARLPGDDLEAQFPDELTWEGQLYPLSYRFEPGGEADGVSVTVPVALLNRVPRHRFDWLVPGLLREKCEALVRGLPKRLRRNLVPVPDTVLAALGELSPADRPLADALAPVLSRLGGCRVTAADFSPASLDDFYRMNVRVVDADGKLLAQDRDLETLVVRFRDETAAAVSGPGAAGPARAGITTWDFGELPGRWSEKQAGIAIVAFPALEDRGESVALRLFDYAEDALASHRRGLARLAALQLARPLRGLRKQLLRANEDQLLFAAAGLEREPLLEDALAAAVLEACGLGVGDCRDAETFEAALGRGNARLIAVVNELEQRLRNLLRPLAAARPQLVKLAVQWPAAVADVEGQLADLLRPGFLVDTPFTMLAQYPRYAKALAHRLERLPAQPGKDEQARAQLEMLKAPLEALLVERPHVRLSSPEIMTYTEMLEEFRVSLFAQQLGTARPVSAKRLARQWEACEAWLAAHPR